MKMRGRGSIMKRALILALLVFSTALMAAAGPRHRPDRTGGTTYSVPEPQSILLLGAGLVGLGIYAKKKNGKKT
jgi:hypothetical protein